MIYAYKAMKVVRVAYIVAFVLAGSVALGAFTGPIVVLPGALIPLVAGTAFCANESGAPTDTPCI